MPFPPRGQLPAERVHLGQTGCSPAGEAAYGDWDDEAMISVELARQLYEAGLTWSPMPGDRFVVDRTGMADDVFHLADMTVEVHRFVGGAVIGFNGVAEWALDSVDIEDTLWLPREDHLRAVLGHDFVGLGMDAVGYAVVALIDGRSQTFSHGDAEEAYGLATLSVLRARQGLGA
ncbi:hypothetical protein ACQBAT_12950 [Ornithinimicrobium sp. Y1847]|uniref:hypothetical protein n=1 Tax=Ornithinimicrobium sp. Y1847 TaxID=3405419 RepID=UPI003B681431